MYAGKISLVSTEKGVGVNTGTRIIANMSDLTIKSDGTVCFKETIAKNNVNIESMSEDVTPTKKPM